MTKIIFLLLLIMTLLSCVIGGKEDYLESLKTADRSEVCSTYHSARKSTWESHQEYADEIKKIIISRKLEC